MPRNINKHKNNRRRKAPFMRPRPDMMQQLARVAGEAGQRNFRVTLLNNQERHASMTRGMSRKIGRIKTGSLVLVQPMTSNPYGNQEIILAYSKEDEKRLESEGYFAVIKESEKEQDVPTASFQIADEVVDDPEEGLVDAEINFEDI